MEAALHDSERYFHRYDGGGEWYAFINAMGSTAFPEAEATIRCFLLSGSTKQHILNSTIHWSTLAKTGSGLWSVPRDPPGAASHRPAKQGLFPVLSYQGSQPIRADSSADTAQR